MKRCEITSLWVQSRIPDYARMCINSFLAHGHKYTLFTYGTAKLHGVAMRDAREIIPESYIWRDAKTGSLAPFSDLFRWAWLQKEGGIWVDSDLACLSDDIPADNALYMCYEDARKNFVGASCIKLPKGHPIAKTMYALSYDPIARMPWENDETYEQKRQSYASLEGRISREQHMPWSYSSTLGVTYAASYYNLHHFVRPSTDIYPVHWRNAITLYNGEANLKQFKDSWGIHLWGHELRKNSLSIFSERKCIMTELVDMYGIS